MKRQKWEKEEESKEREKESEYCSRNVIEHHSHGITSNEAASK